jgi:hypothetical protein
MKSKLLIFVFCLAAFFCTIEVQAQIVKDSLSTTKLVDLYQKVDFGDYEVKFKKVITDSRCPKNVMCVRAGEADVLVSIYKNGDFIKDKKIRIDASGYVMESNNLAFNAEDFKIYGFALKPYPVSTNTSYNYQLELVFKLKILN